MKVSVKFYTKLLSGAALIVLIFTSYDVRCQAKDDNSITFSVVSQRWLTSEEIQKFEDVKGYKIAINLRLSNDTDDEIEYLSSTVHSRPIGYRWERKIGVEEWDYTPRRQKQEIDLSTEFPSIGYCWRKLPSHSYIEGNTLSYTAVDEEFVFSAFVRKNSTDVAREIITPVIRPISAQIP